MAEDVSLRSGHEAGRQPESATVVQPGQTYNVQPFRLDSVTASQPTEFEASFVVDGIRHQYSFAMTAERIVSEQLMVWRTAKPTQWFRRRLDAGDRYEYEFSAYLTGPRKLWQDSTRPNALFLSTAAQLNSELLGPLARWLVQSLVYLPAGAGLDNAHTTALLGSQEGRTAIRDFLGTADISIAEVSAVPRKGFRAQFLLPAWRRGASSTGRRGGDVPDLRAPHREWKREVRAARGVRRHAATL